jgi:thioredoxin reductase (NADPH)
VNLSDVVHPPSPDTTDPVAFPQLTPEQLARLAAMSQRQAVVAGDVLYSAGDLDYDFFVLESAEVDMMSPSTPDATPELVVRHHPGRFLGELSMLTRSAAIVTALVQVPGDVLRMSPEQFQLLMAKDGELSDLILRAFMARRDMLRVGAGARTLELVGISSSPEAQALRHWAARQQLPHLWLEADEPAGAALTAAVGAGANDLPLAITPTATLRRATPGLVAEHLGLSFRTVSGRMYDVVVVGAGPAGLAAAVYGASEGLDTLLLDAVAVGGQAAASARIENYLGFPSGLPGAELTNRALIQAQKFGAVVNTPCPVTRLHAGDGHLHVSLAGGEEIDTHAVVVATGARYRSLDLPDWDRFESTGIFYAATELEARACAAAPVTVVGGANSAGQAALFLAEHGSPVTLAVRGDDLGHSMSSYLVDRIRAHGRVTVRLGAEVTRLEGGSSLEKVTITDRASGESIEAPCLGLFCFIGARPSTDWLSEVALDPDGFVYTDTQLDGMPTTAWDLLGRRPHPYETSVPGVFAVGDVRHGSIKRVAAAVGEGASAIRSVHAVVGTTR